MKPFLTFFLFCGLFCFHYSLAISFLESEMTTEADMALIPLYISQQDYTKASAKITAFSSHTSNLQAYKDLATIGLNLAMNNLGYADMNATQEQTIRSTAATNTVYANQAKGILYQAFGETYTIDVPIYPNQSSKRANILDQKVEDFVFQLIPNPANQHFQIHWSHSISEANLHIYNAVGKKIEQYKVQNGENIAINHLPSGLYICTLEIAETIQLHQKLVVNH